MIGPAGRRRHRIGNQHETVVPLGREGDAQVRLMHVVAIGDNAYECVGKIERGADHARLASDRRAHCIEQMGESARSRLDSGARFLIARLWMAKRDEHAPPREFGDAVLPDAIGRERHHDRTAIRVDDGLDVAGCKIADVFEFMRALAARVQEGPFQVEAECRGDPATRLARRGDGSGHHLRRVGHERRQQTDGPVFAMRGGDTRDGLRCRVIVEQDAAAAVDLHVDIPGREQAAGEIARGP